MYRILDDIEFVVPGPDDWADDPPLGCVALNQAVLAAGLRLSFPKIVRKFLREWGIAPTQLCPNGWRIMIGLLILWDQLGFPRPSVREFNSLYSFKSNGKRSGWWYAQSKRRLGVASSPRPRTRLKIGRSSGSSFVDTSLKSPQRSLQKELDEPRISARISSQALF
ncbi:Plus3 domain-containing protein [Abeliophyllum distichum]|uniref:Plus3 domain-containing protein n=1 Tax=Abeliophyllum distichum TaxID=126358 RepID=A0ABD1W051_9LAMI